MTRRRVLDAALAAADDSGLGRISFEDAIREADVSRTAAYRCWPQRDAFLADLAVELAEQAIPAAPTRNKQATRQLRSLVGERADRLATADGRAAVLDEIVRVTAVDDFDLDRAETARWRTYLMLVMSLQTMPEGELHDRVAAAVGDADDRLNDRLASSYRRIVEFFGFRALVDYPTLAGIGAAFMRGLIIGDLARSGRRSADRAALPSVAFAGLVTANTEPADTSDWDQSMITARLAELDTEDFFDPR
ncbi:MAG TPA: hypothetical protein VIP98_07580 [Microlunatus sp.]